MNQDHLLRTWAMLATLSAVSTLLHFSTLSGAISGSVILIIAGIRARLVLLDYLELRGVESWSTGMTTALSALIALLLVLLLAA